MTAEPEPLTSLPKVVTPDEALTSMPSWVRDIATRVSPAAGRASQLIEARVMAEIEKGFREEDEATAVPALPAPSVADEIAKLRALRDEGALTDEQYSKALDRTVTGRD